MNPCGTSTRHAKIADDSKRVCIILPKTAFEEIKSVCESRSTTMSAMVRDFIVHGLYNELRRGDGKRA